MKKFIATLVAMSVVAFSSATAEAQNNQLQQFKNQAQKFAPANYLSEVQLFRRQEVGSRRFEPGNLRQPVTLA